MKKNIYDSLIPKLILSLGILMVDNRPIFAYDFEPNISVNSVTQRNIILKGSVTDKNGEPLIGASVRIKGTDKGVITDLDGNYEINLPSSNSVLIFSYLGYEDLEKKVNGRSIVNVVLDENVTALDEVTVVGYGQQKKATLTGAISSIDTKALLRTPNGSLSNVLAGQIPGLSSVQSSGQPGADDATIYVRGVGTLNDADATPLILVDGVERAFFQMDPNEIESVTVLKDASATAVFGVRGANGVILVTTKRGEEGKAKISVSSSVGIQQPTRILQTVNSYDWATLYNERQINDGVAPELVTFSPYVLERFEKGDSPIMFPSVNWREYLTKDISIQTQHNVNISGGTKNVKYFISAGFMFQDGIFKNFEDELGYDTNYKYKRYNYRANLDLNVTRTTVLKLGIGGIVGDKREPSKNLFERLSVTQPFASPGVVDGKRIITAVDRYSGIQVSAGAFETLFGGSFKEQTNNTLNIDAHLVQDLSFITKGLSAEVKGAYNTDYSYGKTINYGMETYTPYFRSEFENPDLVMGESPDYNYDVVYRVTGKNTGVSYGNLDPTRARDWYLEGSLRYARKFGDHDISVLALYNQSKKYYPKYYTDVPTAYVGFVGRLTYNYKSRYLAEFNFGYNGSENFAPDKRFGKFPAGSVAYVISEEPFMKDNGVVDFLKVRASVGLVGNDNMSNYRFLYLPDGYEVNVSALLPNGYSDYSGGYIFGATNTNWDKGVLEKSFGNKNVTWEKALKTNVGFDINFFQNRLRITADFFKEKRTDILIKRGTVPALTSLDATLLPVLNLGRVDNKGYELDVKWNDMVGDLSYWTQLNISYSKNKIIYQDEVEPNEPYMWRTGHQTGHYFGKVAERLYQKDDFNPDGTLKEGYPVPEGANVAPGDLKFKDLNNDMVIDGDDSTVIGGPKRPLYTIGLNYGLDWKGFFLTMNWMAGLGGNLNLSYSFNNPFKSGGAIYQYLFDGRWTEDNAEEALYPRVCTSMESYNNVQGSSWWIKDNSYLKLKTMTIGYNFTNKKFLKAIGASMLSLKLSGYNILTIDGIKFMDPEGEPSNADKYPVIKSYSFGVNLTF